MAGHSWGDNWPYWSDLYKAERMLEKELKRYRMPVFQIKEKFGEIRCYMVSPWNNLHDLIWPGHCFCRWPKYLEFMWTLDIYVWPKVFKWTGLQFILNHIYIRAYTLAYEKTARAFPHIRDEILSDADHDLLLNHMEDWSKYWSREYPEPNPTWKAYWRNHV